MGRVFDRSTAMVQLKARNEEMVISYDYDPFPKQLTHELCAKAGYESVDDFAVGIEESLAQSPQ